jgi:hypothetical protein
VEQVKLKGFAPDLDPMTPGIFSDCDEMIPSQRGFEPLPGRQLKFSALPGPCRGSVLAYNMAGAGRVIAGTSSNLWAYNGSAWVMASRQGEYPQASAMLRWRFAQYGNYTIAVNGLVEPQLLKTTTSRFTNLGGSPPKGKYVETVGYFLFMFAPPGQPNQWWCSGLGNPENWTTDFSSQSANGTLVQTPGEITGAKALGDAIVVYKENSTYIGQYVGPPFVWAFKAVSTEAGALGNDCVVAVADAHVLIGREQFYVLNGSGPPQKVDSPLTDWFFGGELDMRYKDRIIGWWDKRRDIVFWHYPSMSANPAGTLDRWLAWNMGANVWTRGRLVIEDVTTVQTQNPPAVTYDQFGTLLAHWDDYNTLAYEDPLIVGTRETARGIFLSDHALYTLTGTPGDSYFVTSDLGDATNYFMVRRVRPLFSRFPTKPTSASLTLKDNLGAGYRSGQMAVLNRESGWINLRQSARLHRLRMNFQGDYEVMSFLYDAVPQGSR